MSRYIKVITLACALLSVSLYGIASGLDWKVILNQSGGSNKWYCYTTFTIDMKGNWSSYSEYSNGRHVESGRFISTFKLRSKDGSDIITLTQNRHVKGSHGGSAREETTEERGKLPVEVLELIDTNKTGYDCTVKSDFNAENLAKAIVVAQWVLEL